ncbi:MAG: DUF4439 domain-containing protein [Brooklawnia sp.]|jgi:hypothetical protein
MSPGHRGLTRRNFLQYAAGLPVVAGLAACAPSPLITPQADTSPMPAPTMDQPRRLAARAAADLAELASGCAAIAEADGRLTDWLAALAEQHRAHQTVLSQADPLGGVQSDHSPLEEIVASPLPVPATQDDVMRVLAAQHNRLADILQPMVDDPASEPGMALLWISQQLAARITAAAMEPADVAGLGPPPTAGGAVPAELSAPGDAEQARQVLLSHQRALVFGLQAMLGQAAHDDPVAAALGDRLGQAMRERDQTAAQISDTGTSPEPAAAEYELPGGSADPSQRELTWGRLEYAVAAAWARVAAMDAAGREDASANALVQASRARDHGFALPYWPGWV